MTNLEQEYYNLIEAGDFDGAQALITSRAQVPVELRAEDLLLQSLDIHATNSGGIADTIRQLHYQRLEPIDTERRVTVQTNEAGREAMNRAVRDDQIRIDPDSAAAFSQILRDRDNALMWGRGTETDPGHSHALQSADFILFDVSQPTPGDSMKVTESMSGADMLKYMLE